MTNCRRQITPSFFGRALRVFILPIFMPLDATVRAKRFHCLSVAWCNKTRPHFAPLRKVGLRKISLSSNWARGALSSGWWGWFFNTSHDFVLFQNQPGRLAKQNMLYVCQRNCINAEYKEWSRSYCEVIEVVNRSSGIFLVFIVICLYKEWSRSYCEVVDLNHSFGSAASGQKARHW